MTNALTEPLDEMDVKFQKPLIEQPDAFRTFVEELPVIFYAVEPAPPYSPIYVSPAFAAFGYPLEMWTTDPDVWLRVIHPDDQERVFGETRSSTLSGKEVEYEYRIVAADGSIRWVHDRGHLVKDSRGNIVRRQGVIFDITQQKLADLELEESETRYRDLFEKASDLIYVIDLDGRYVSINDACARVFGYTREEALQLTWRDITAPDQHDAIRQRIQEKIAGLANETTYEADCITKDGRRVTLEINSGLLYKDGVPVGIQGVARDITERKRTEEALIRREREYRDLFENANDLIFTQDLEGNFTSLNRAGERITGYSREEAVKMNMSEVVAPEFLEAARKMVKNKLAGDASASYELEIIAKDGRRVSLDLSTRLIVKDGRPVGVQGIGRDITERKRAERELHETLSLLASTFESTADGIVVFDEQLQIISYNRKFIQMWQVPGEILATRDGRQLAAYAVSLLKDPEEGLAQLQELLDDPLAVGEHMLELADGRVFERYSQPRFLKGKPMGRVCCYRDITERKRAEEMLRHHALHDTLTSLPNRTEFMKHLTTAVERTKRNPSARFAVLFLDLDRFKVINDSLGHVVGDKLLIAIAERLRASVRPGDVIARLGGDEFTILLNRTGDPDEVAKVAERLLSKISEPFKLDSYEVFTSASIGIILSDDLHRDPEDFLRDADAAMYRAKETGKARYEIFDREMHKHNLHALQLELDLRRAIERNEFEIHYQPIVMLDSGRVNEFEALIRWRHPQRGLILPDHFIRVAEETGMIIPIGEWILEKACRQTAEWQRSCSTLLSVSVNLSAKQLMHPHLTSVVKRILNDSGLSPRQLKLEVTESTVMEHSDNSHDVLNELAELGVLLSTDDFGTGYSSLSYLHRFPFSRLKIDRSFVCKMADDRKSEAIVKSILMLGQNLNIEVVAEGIETDIQLRLLRGLGCELGQGYRFSPGVAADEVQGMLQAAFTVGGASNDEFADVSSPVEVAEVQ
ncbi:MAG: PAS domain S-box protein [Pyrinomonadaceae bacterium]